MRIAILAALAAALAIPLAGCGGSAQASADQAKIQREADLYAIEQIEAKWHKAASTKDIDLMMSLWAPDAVWNVGPQTLRGKQQIRDFVLKNAAPYQPQNHWLSETPAYKIRVTVNGDKGTLAFECHYVDVNTGKVVAVVGADQQVQKIDGKWLITSLAASTPTLEP